MIIKVLQLHKREALVFDKIEDKYAFNPNDNVYALADGASQKFRSGEWAEKLVSSFIRDPKFEPDAFKREFLSLAETFDKEEVAFSDNPAMRAIEKKKVIGGASCTFLGMGLDSKGEGKLIACGDANFFQFRQQEMMDCFPYQNWEGVRNNNSFLNTKRILEKAHDDTVIKPRSFNFLDGDLLVLASDALSCLIFKDSKVVDELWAMNDFDTFLKFCKDRWDNKTLTEDDISAIIIKVSDEHDTEKLCPPEGFAFPKPVAPILNYKPNQNEDMREIMQQLNRIGNELRHLFYESDQKREKSVKLILMILGAGIFLSLINLFLLFKQHPSNKEVTQLEMKIDSLNNYLSRNGHAMMRASVYESNDPNTSKVTPDSNDKGRDTSGLVKSALDLNTTKPKPDEKGAKKATMSSARVHQQNQKTNAPGSAKGVLKKQDDRANKKVAPPKDK